MIFVLLGISVLVASFLVALVSLIREQSKQSEAEGIEEAKKTLRKNGLGTAASASAVVNTSRKKQDKKDALPKEPDAPEPTINRPLFPWEEGRYKSAEGELDADRQKVEILRAQLAQLKQKAQAKGLELSMQSVPEDLKQVPVVDNSEKKQVFSDNDLDKGPGKLSGEISITDLKGSS